MSFKRLPKMTDERAQALGYRNAAHLIDVAWNSEERAAHGFALGELKEQIYRLRKEPPK